MIVSGRLEMNDSVKSAVGLAFFVYKRPDLTKQVIESLSRNPFPYMYVFQDGLKDEKHRREWEEVSQLINNIDFCKTEIVISDYNKGLANSIIAGMNYVFDRHDRAIALEDDILLSPGYRDFMEKCFDYFEDYDDVTSIAGVGAGTIIPDDYKWDVYFSYRMSSAAFGTWKKYWKDFYIDPFVLREINLDSEKKAFLDKAGNDLEMMIHASVSGRIDTWATYWSLYQVKLKSYQVIPSIGLAKDIGREGGGTNSKHKHHRYAASFNDERLSEYSFPREVVIDQRIVEDTLAVLNLTKQTELYNFYNDLYYNWIRSVFTGRKLVDFFINNHYESVYIYGTANAGQLLYEQIAFSI